MRVVKARFYTSHLPTLNSQIRLMTLNDLLSEKRAIILQRWFDRILEDYPLESQAFFRENKSPYSNPIGFALRRGMEGVIDYLLRPATVEEARAILEPVMKVRAVENLPPFQGGKFFLPLREIFGEIMKEAKTKDLPGREWLDLNSQISQLALLGMNLYSECREKVNQLRITEGEKRARLQDRRSEV